jgi:hypothetical protein
MLEKMLWTQNNNGHNVPILQLKLYSNFNQFFIINIGIIKYLFDFYLTF